VNEAGTAASALRIARRRGFCVRARLSVFTSRSRPCRRLDHRPSQSLEWGAGHSQNEEGIARSTSTRVPAMLHTHLGERPRAASRDAAREHSPSRGVVNIEPGSTLTARCLFVLTVTLPIPDFATDDDPASGKVEILDVKTKASPARKTRAAGRCEEHSPLSRPRHDFEPSGGLERTIVVLKGASGGSRLVKSLRLFSYSLGRRPVSARTILSTLLLVPRVEVAPTFVSALRALQLTFWPQTPDQGDRRIHAHSFLIAGLRTSARRRCGRASMAPNVRDALTQLGSIVGMQSRLFHRIFSKRKPGAQVCGIRSSYFGLELHSADLSFCGASAALAGVK